MEKLVKKAQKGDKDAFIELIELNKVALTRAAKAILKRDEDVADAVSETVISAAQSIHSLKNAKYFKTWITRILINHSYKILSWNKRIIPFESIGETQDSSYTEDNDTSIDVRDTLKELSENDRLVLTLFYLDDISIKDIAKMLDVSENTIKQRLSRGRKRFKTAYIEREVERREAY